MTDESPPKVEWRPQTERDSQLTHGIDWETQTGLEIGALNNPVIPAGVGNIEFVDYTDSESLRTYHREHPDRVANIVEVDHVWSGSGSLLERIGGSRRFDFALASHVIEHVPNALGWFRGIREVLKPGGIFNLAVPDQRFTFDIARELSTLGELVEADLLNYEIPSIRQMFDHTYEARALNNPSDTWVRGFDRRAVPRLLGDQALSVANFQAKEILSSSKYFDSHCWTFTPLSLLKLLKGALTVGLFDFVPTRLVPTQAGQFEFFLQLQRAPDDLEDADLRELQTRMVDKLIFDVEDRQRWLGMLAAE